MPHASETPRLLPVAMVAESGAGAEAGEATVSCLMVRGPATASTALCAMALPPPNAKPASQQIIQYSSVYNSSYNSWSILEAAQLCN